MDRRDERRRRAREMRDGGASLSEIGEALGVSKATAMRDCRAAGGAASVLPERPVTASGAPGAGMVPTA